MTGNPPRVFSSLIRMSNRKLCFIGSSTEYLQMRPSRREQSVQGTGFGVLALVLAYGVIAAGVSRRINEIGVRVRLGARAEQVVGMVLSEAMSLALAGVGAGLCAALLLTRVLRSMLFGLQPADPLTLPRAGLLLSVAAPLAAWVLRGGCPASNQCRLGDMS